MTTTSHRLQLPALPPASDAALLGAWTVRARPGHTARTLRVVVRLGPRGAPSTAPTDLPREFHHVPLLGAPAPAVPRTADSRARAGHNELAA